MRIAHDVEVGALYLHFIETTATAGHVAGGVVIDYAADGQIAGIEVLDAQKHLGEPEALRRVIVENIALGKSTPALESWGTTIS